MTPTPHISLLSVFKAVEHINYALNNAKNPEIRLMVLRGLQRSGLVRPSRSEIRYWRVAAAAQLLASGATRAEAMAALRERFGVSARTAYRLLAEAGKTRC